MNLFNRFLIVVFAVVWTGLLVAGLVLVWDTSHYLNVDSDEVQFSLRLSLTRAEQVLGSMAIVALILPALALVLFEVTSAMRPRREPARGRQSEQAARESERLAVERYGTIESRLDRIESMVSSRPPQTAELSTPEAPPAYEPIAEVGPEPAAPPSRPWFGGGTSVSPS